MLRIQRYNFYIDTSIGSREMALRFVDIHRKNCYVSKSSTLGQSLLEVRFLVRIIRVWDENSTLGGPTLPYSKDTFQTEELYLGLPKLPQIS